MSLNFIWYCLLFFIGYKFVTKIVWPLFKTFLVIRTKVNTIKDQFKTEVNTNHKEPTHKNNTQKKEGSIKVKSEYIDFEDVK